MLKNKMIRNLSDNTRFARLYSGKSLHHSIGCRESSMLIIYSATVFTKCYSYPILFARVSTLAGEYETFTSNSHLMDESLCLEGIHDTIEGREIHSFLSLFSDETLFEI